MKFYFRTHSPHAGLLQLEVYNAVLFRIRARNHDLREIPRDSASRYLQILSITSLPLALFCWNLSTHLCSIFSAIDARVEMGFIRMLVSCLQMVHSFGFSGWGSYLIFSSTSMTLWRLILRVASCIERYCASTTVDSTQWHIS